MSGADVPYQLRTNKYVERQLFMDVLDHVRIWNGPAKYLYASMGGRFLEDFRLINDRFAVEKMISIESEEWVWRRQGFNRPLSFIECLLRSSEDFVRDFDRLTAEYSEYRFIVWMDYAAPEQRGAQLQEYRELVSKLGPGDVVKITLNANRDWWLKRGDFRDDEGFACEMIRRIEQQLGEYLPQEVVAPEDLSDEGFARLLAGAVRVAALKGKQASPGLQIRPLAAFRYRDGRHQMVTSTAFIGDDQLSQKMESDQVFADQPFRAADWDDVKWINVPDVSARERTEMNRLLRTGAEENLHANLPFRLAPEEPDSFELFRQYLEHYRRYPTFRVVHP